MFELLSPDDAKWMQLLEKRDHDVYHLPEYASLAALSEQGEPFVAVSDHMFLPIIKRAIPNALDCFDAISPYGYPGPLLSHVEGFAEYIEAGRQQYSLVTSFIRCHPILTANELYECVDVEAKQLGHVVLVDLSLDETQILAHYSDNHKRGIKKLLKQGFHVVVNDWDHYDDFVQIYQATMVALGANDYYLFSPQYFAQLALTLKAHTLLITVLNEYKQVAASGLFFMCNNMIEYHLGGTAADFRAQAPSKLMFDEVIRFGLDNGYDYVNLGSGVGFAEDSLFAFKQGFSKRCKPYYVLRIVHDKPRYDELNQQTAVAEDDFFPAYRKIQT